MQRCFNMLTFIVRTCSVCKNSSCKETSVCHQIKCKVHTYLSEPKMFFVLNNKGLDEYYIFKSMKLTVWLKNNSNHLDFVL